MRQNMDNTNKKYQDLKGYMLDNLETQSKIVEINSDQKTIQDELRSVITTLQSERKKKRKTE